MSEEKSLDDFFAKKDKGKKGKKKKCKFTTTDEICKNLTTEPSEQQPRKTTKKIEKERKDENDTDGSNTQGVNNTPEPVEEWNEVVEKEKDYSDLKIQALQVSDETKQEQDEAEDDEVDENGEPIRDKGSSGPWNKIQTPEPPVSAEPVQEAPKVETPNVVGGKYVPPSKRHLPASDNKTTLTYQSKYRNQTRKNVAPQIGSEQEFPTLAASSDILKYSDKREERTFETVTKGGTNADGASRSGGPNLALDNRFSALGQ